MYSKFNLFWGIFVNLIPRSESEKSYDYSLVFLVATVFLCVRPHNKTNGAEELTMGLQFLCCRVSPTVKPNGAEEVRLQTRDIYQESNTASSIF